MKPAEIVKNLRTLREAWRKQSFSFTSGQQVEYDRLVALRRERVKYMCDNDMVYKGGIKQVVSTK